MLTTAEAVHALAGPVNDVGGRWMLDVEVLGPSKQAGYPNGYAYYVAGRGGVLGDVDADVVGSAFGFFEPALVRKMWNAGIAVEGARAAAARYGAACAQWGRTRLQGFAEARRAAELMRHVIDSIDSSGLALFAGWRNEPRPDDAPALAYLLTHVLRELRGSVHIVAVLAAGLTPREAMLAASGVGTARQFGWSEPFPDVAHLLEQRAEAEAVTNAIMTRFFDHTLNAAECNELLELINSLKAHLDA
jgi:hypothetical protein